jgi:hypothetical protein
MERRIEYLPIDGITEAITNPKEHDLDRVQASINTFGYVAPMIIDERTGRLIVGHGRLQSLQHRQAAGEDPPDGITTNPNGQWLAPVVRGWSSRSDADASAYLVADNRHTELGGWDHQALSDLLANIGDPDLIELTGWDPAELDKLLTPESDEATPPEEFPPYDDDLPTSYCCPSCGFKWSGKPE